MGPSVGAISAEAHRRVPIEQLYLSLGLSLSFHLVLVRELLALYVQCLLSPRSRDP